MGGRLASNFSFHPFGLSVMVTVTASLSTVSFSIVRSGGTTATVGPTAPNNYMPSSVRIANPGSVSVFIGFGDSTVTTGLASGIMMLPTSVEVFGINGLPFMAIICGTTTTVNLTYGEGQ